MAAATAAEGMVALSDSQAMPAPDKFTNYEDPARCWIDLVIAFRAEKPDQVRSVLEQAKQSHWDHDLYNEALIAGAEEEPMSSDPECSTTEEYDDTQDEFWEE